MLRCSLDHCITCQQGAKLRGLIGQDLLHDADVGPAGKVDMPAAGSRATAELPTSERARSRDCSAMTGSRYPAPQEMEPAAEEAEDQLRAAVDEQDAPQRRAICTACARPARVCICDALPARPLPVSTPIVLWQHPSEAKRPLQTGSLLRLSLAADSFDIVCGRSFSCLTRSPLWERIQAEGRVPLLLYPAPGAASLREVLAAAEPGARFALVAVDGTWKEAREMIRKQGAIAATPVTLGEAAASGVFAIRKPPAEGCLSTLEAVARALDELEPPPAAEMPPLSSALLRPMLRVVEIQASLQKRQVHRPGRPGYRPQLAEEVAGAMQSLQLVDGARIRASASSTTRSRLVPQTRIQASGGARVRVTMSWSS